MEKTILTVLALTVIAGAFVLPVERLGDTSNYYLMTVSLYHDHDLVFDQRDAGRMNRVRFGDVPAGTILIFSKGRYVFGKPYLYSLLNVPFYPLLGPRCFIFTNLLMFAWLFYLSYRHLRRHNPVFSALMFTLLFYFCSVVPFYLFWIHEEIFYYFLVGLCFHLLTGFLDKPDRTRLLVWAAVIAGIAAAGKLINALLFIPVLLLMPRKPAAFPVKVVLAGLAPIILILGIYYLHTGVPTYFSGAVREMYYTFEEMPFFNPAQPFQSHGRNVVLSDMTPGINWSFVPANLFYFCFGRYSGILIYFLPLAAALALSRRDRLRPVILGLLALWALGLCFGRSYNYFGGTPLGNRYFHLYPAMIFLVATIHRRKTILGIFIAATVLILPLYSHPLRHSQMPYSHGVYFPYRFLPLEKTQVRGLPDWGCPISPWPGTAEKKSEASRKLNYGDVYLFFPDFTAEVYPAYWFVPHNAAVEALLEISENLSYSCLLQITNYTVAPVIATVECNGRINNYSLAPGEVKRQSLNLDTRRSFRRIERYWRQGKLVITAAGGELMAEIVFDH